MLPKRYNVVDFEPCHSDEIRKLPVNNYIVFYWVDDKNFIIKISRIIYSRRNLQKTFDSKEYPTENNPSYFINEEREPYGTK